MNTRSYLKAAVCGLALLGLLTGCSKDKDEKGAVEKMSDKVGKQAAAQITAPIDKARDSQALQNAQNQKIEDMAGQNGTQTQQQN